MTRIGNHSSKRPIVRCLVALGVFSAALGCNLGPVLLLSPTPPATETLIVETATVPSSPTSTATPEPETATVTATTEPAETPVVDATSTVDGSATATATATSAPTPSPSPTPLTTCTVLPEGPFLGIWQADPARQAALGCPTSNHPRITPVAWEVLTSYQPFENGAMVWTNQIGWYEQPVIYVLYAAGEYARYDDAYGPGDPDPVATPPAGFLVPVFGFGKLWDEHPDIRTALGWATASEMPGPGRFQLFIAGEMMWLSQRGESYIFVHDPTPTYAIEITPAFVN